MTAWSSWPVAPSLAINGLSSRRAVYNPPPGSMAGVLIALKPMNVDRLTVLFIGLALSMSAASQAIWPNCSSEIQPDASESLVAAQAPADARVQAPDASLPTDKARWSGEWSGWACQGRLCDLKLIVESVRSDGATIVYSAASSQAGAISHRLKARFNADELQAVLASGMQIAFRMRTDNVVEVVEVVGHSEGKVSFGGVLSNRPLGSRIVERIPTPFVESSKPIFLEMVIYKPPGAGPFPTLIFKHGSTGNGDDSSDFHQHLDQSRYRPFFQRTGQDGRLSPAPWARQIGWPLRRRVRAEPLKIFVRPQTVAIRI